MTGSDADVIPFPRRLPDVGPAPHVPHALTIRVDLDEAEPAIWRRLVLAGDLTLADVHEVLQTAMGWTDSHLHQFSTGSDRTVVAPFLTDFDVEEGDEGIRERDVRLDQVLRQPGDAVGYLYDFGDGWEHTLVLESVRPSEPQAPRAVVLDGRRSCPPEDCGGVHGYGGILAALEHGPADAHQRDVLEWLGPFDPDAFSVTETDRRLRLVVAGLGGASAVKAALQEGGRAFSKPLAELVERSRREPKQLATLLAAADLPRADLPAPEAAARLVRPWTRFLELVDAGVQLTSAGWLPPSLVSRLADDLELVESWMGKANREQHFPPVRIIRSSAGDLGLVRKRKGQLLPTALGLRLARDPEALWRHVAASLPLGSKLWERDAGAIMLLAIAAGESAYDVITRRGGDLLWSAGWSVDGSGPPDGWDVLEHARPTWDALRVMGSDSDRRGRRGQPDGVRQLARAASTTTLAPDRVDG